MPSVKSNNYFAADELDKSRGIFSAIPIYSSAIADITKHLTVVSASLPYHQLISILVCDNLLLVLRLQKNMQCLESVRMIKKFVFVLRGVFS